MSKYGLFTRFLLVTLPAWGREHARRSAFRRLLRELKADKSGLYNPVFNSLTPVFAAAVAELAASAAKLAPVYKLTISGDEAKERKATLDLARKILGGYDLELRSLSFAGIQEELSSKGLPKVEDIDSAFKTRIEVFSQDVFQDCSTGLGHNHRLAALCEFDFASLLEPFRATASPAHLFGPSPGGLAVEGLLDLHFLLHGLNTGESTAKVLGLLSEGGLDADKADQAREAFKSLVGVLSGRLDPRRLGKVIRCIQGDADLELKSEEVDTQCLTEVVLSLNEDFGKARREFLDRKSQEDFDKRIHDLFGDLPLLPTEGYTIEHGTLLAKGGLGDFTYIKPLQILKSFFAFHFRTVVEPALFDFLVDADLPDREFKKALGEGVQVVKAMEAALLQFEGDMSSAFLMKLGPALDLAAKNLLEVHAKNKWKREVDETNWAADRLIQTSFEKLGLLRSLLARLVEDLRSRNPQLVANAPFLLSMRADHVKKVLKAGQLLDKALAVLRLFAVDLTAAKSHLRKPDKLPG